MDLDSLLSKNVDDVKAPVPIPQGHYEGTILGHEFGQSKQNKTPFVEFKVRLEAAGPDVPFAELAELENPLPAERKCTFYLTPDSLFILAGFLKNTLQIPGAANRPIKELIPEATNRRALWKIKHTAIVRNGENSTIAVIDAYAPISS